MTIQRTPVKTRPVPTAPPAKTVPANIPKVNIKRYVPPAPKTTSNVADRGNKWMRTEAMEHYDPLVVQGRTAVFAWSPIPMMSSEDPSVFGATRYYEDESQFDEWAYATPLVRRAGTDFAKQVTFCPYGGAVMGSEDFISSPYATLYGYIANLNREKKFSESSPWYLLLNWGKLPSGKSSGNFLPPIRTFYLMLSTLLLSSKNEYNRDTKTATELQEVFVGQAADGNTAGKGLVDDGKLTVLAISQQIWNDLSKAMNTRDRAGNWVYPDPCDPYDLAVFYAWNHKAANCPVPGIKSTTQIDGMSGAVAGQVFAPGNKQLADRVKLPSNMLSPQNQPTADYYAKVPMHIGETINYMDDLTMIKELANAFADARVLFEMAFKRTDFEQYLEEPEIKAIFGGVAQKFIYDSSIYEGAPVSRQAATAFPKAQQAPMAPLGTPPKLVARNTGSPMGNANQPPPLPPTGPGPQQEEDEVDPLLQMMQIPLTDIYAEEDTGFAVDTNGNRYFDADGNPVDATDLVDRIVLWQEGQDWNP